MGAKTRYLLAMAALLVAAAAAAFFLMHKQPHTVHPAPPSATAPSRSANAVCVLPGPAPVPPDGLTATAADMQLGHDVIQRFVEQLEHYQACLNNKIDHPAPGVTAQQKDTWTQQGDSAVDEANALAQAFSVQLKIFKAHGRK
jgi:hypothetical protein